MEDDLALNNEGHLKRIPAKVFLEAFKAIVYAAGDISDEDKDKLCLHIWIDANHPVLGTFHFALNMGLYRSIGL